MWHPSDRLFAAYPHVAAEKPAFEFRHIEQQTGGTKHPVQVDLSAHHSETGDELGSLRYFPPKRRGSPVDVDSITTKHPGVGSALLNEMESRHPGSRTNFLWDVKRNNNNPDVTGHDTGNAGKPSDWDTHYPNLTSEVHRGMALTLPERSARVVNSSAPKENHLAALREGLAGEAMGTHWTENEHAAQLFAHNAVSDYRTTVPVVVHAQTPQRKDIETRQDHLYRGGVFPYGDAHSSENEVPVRKGRTVSLTGISWRPDAHHPDADENGWVHHTYDEPMQRKAVRFFTSASERPSWADGEFNAKNGDTYYSVTEPKAVTMRTPSGRMAGYVNWGDNDVIGNMNVLEQHQRRGIATELLRRAREQRPGLQHSDRLSNDAQKWLKSIGETD
jgi:GNAT superfamily N-acetyltransferase